MKLTRYIIDIIIINLIILLAGYLVSAYFYSPLKFIDVIILSLCFTVITILSIVIFRRGLKKEPGSQTMHLLVAIVVKMLLEMFLALIWFFILKKTSAPTLILFFVLYLSFTFYLVMVMLKILKRKALQ